MPERTGPEPRAGGAVTPIPGSEAESSSSVREQRHHKSGVEVRVGPDGCCLQDLFAEVSHVRGTDALSSPGDEGVGRPGVRETTRPPGHASLVPSLVVMGLYHQCPPSLH